ncbi:MAG: hypothetical protein KAW56_12135 [Candidatus Marinimicrobia bacterium]|nr:hypothetical protein [Candidatus Neomarinimicrobiota bacterium]
MKTVNEKYINVIENNTFYYFDDEFEEIYEKHIFSVKEAILYLKNEVTNNGCKKEVFTNFLLTKKEIGLKAILAITGFSNESLKRLITVIRIVNDNEVNRLVLRKFWDDISDEKEISEWGTNKIEKLIISNEYFRNGLINIFFEGSTHSFFQQTLPAFELQKLSLEKLQFNIDALIDTLARYKEKGSRAAKGKNNPEVIIEKLLNSLNISFEKGDLNELIEYESDTKRTMDFIIPDKENPLIIIESSFLTTTSSGQGDKSKTEISIDTLLKKHYPKAKFVGFVDGIGWYVRKNDLKRMVAAYEDVFTFNKEELERFNQFLKEVIDYE